MWLIDRLAEARIGEALARGELDNLPGSGQALALADDMLVPEELRVAYRLLKNAGFVPPQVELLREIRQLEVLLQAVHDQAEHRLLSGRLQLLSLRLNAGRRQGSDLRLEQDYHEKLMKRLSAP